MIACICELQSADTSKCFNRITYHKNGWLIMARFIQAEANKGSQKWIQKLVNEKPQLLNSLILSNRFVAEKDEIQWLSPLKEDGYAEYRDEACLELLKVDLKSYPLKDFWPKNGPQWDALGKSMSGKLFLVEAKSHIPELISNLKASNQASTDKIFSSFKQVREHFGSKTDFGWSKTFYQYANRLAHVDLLRRNGLSAYLLFVYFLNDSEMSGPTTSDEWKGAIRLVHCCLGLQERLLKNFVADLFIDVRNL
jgi:hypothetical protein